MSILAMIAALTLATPAPADETPTLRIGDRAPAIEIEHWLSVPEGVQQFVTPGDGKIYVLDFWATWCAPCIADMPHVSELAGETADKGVVIIGVSDEDAETVTAFLDRPVGKEKRRDTLRQVIAADPDKSTHESILVASGDVSIPRAVVIGKTGEIEWIGHPVTDHLDEVLEKIIAGTWDRNAWRDALEKRMAFDKQFAKLLADEEWEQAAELAGEDWQLLNDIAWRIAFDPEGKIKNRNFPLAERYATRALQINNAENSFPVFVIATIEAERGNFAKAASLADRALQMEGPGGTWTGYYQQSKDQWEQKAAEAAAKKGRR